MNDPYATAKTILQTAIKIGALVALLILSLPMLAVAWYLFSYWIKIRTTDVFYVEYPYLAYALIASAVGLFSLVCTARATWQWDFLKPHLLLIPLFAVITSVVSAK